MLYFYAEKFEFWDIYESIKRFYPIGIRKDDTKMYLSYPGIKELENLVVDNIHDEGHFEERWVSFEKEIENELGKEVIGTTYGQAPSFSSSLLLEKSIHGDFARIKEVHFFVSFVGPFYAVIGEDRNVLNTGDGRHYHTTNYLVISPEGEFSQAFNFLCNKIENRFAGFRFVPFNICQQTIEGLEVRYNDRTLNSVFNALFNDQIDLAGRRGIGNDYFKNEDWIKEDYVDKGGWTSYPPLRE